MDSKKLFEVAQKYSSLRKAAAEEEKINLTAKNAAIKLIKNFMEMTGADFAGDYHVDDVAFYMLRFFRFKTSNYNTVGESLKQVFQSIASKYIVGSFETVQNNDESGVSVIVKIPGTYEDDKGGLKLHSYLANNETALIDYLNKNFNLNILNISFGWDPTGVYIHIDLAPL